MSSKKQKAKSVVKSGIKALGGAVLGTSAGKAGVAAAKKAVYDARKTYVLFFGDIAPREKAGLVYKSVKMPGTGYQLLIGYETAGADRGAEYLIKAVTVHGEKSTTFEDIFKTAPTLVAPAEGIAAPALFRVTVPKSKTLTKAGNIPIRVDVLMQMQQGGFNPRNVPIALPSRMQPIDKQTPGASRVLPMIAQNFNLTAEGIRDPIASLFVRELKGRIAQSNVELFSSNSDIWMVDSSKRRLSYMTVDRQQGMYYRLMREFAHAVFEAVVNKHNQKANSQARPVIASSLAASSSSGAGDAPVYDEEEGVIYTDSDRDVPLGVFTESLGEGGAPIAGIFSKSSGKERRARKTAVRGRRYFLVKTRGPATAQLNYFDPAYDGTASNPKLDFEVTRKKLAGWNFAKFEVRTQSGRLVAQGYTPALIAVDRFPTDKKKHAKVLLFNTSSSRLVITGGPRARGDAVANGLLKLIRKAAKGKEDASLEDEKAFKAAARAAAMEHGKYKKDRAKQKALTLRVRDKIEYASPAFAALGPQ